MMASSSAEVTEATTSHRIPSPDSSYASSGGSGESLTKCEISLLERLIRTHPLWFLPSLQRSGAQHLLQGREIGNFIVRSSREPNTMALSVRLNIGNLVEHYLLQARDEDGRISLQDSEHSFPTVHQLIAHYCTQSDEIPVCLRVPTAISEANSRQQLRSLALLGQEFWTLTSPQPTKELCCPTGGSGSTPSLHGDVDSTKLSSSGLGSQSSSSQNSLNLNHEIQQKVPTKPPRACRPTTLELGKSRSLLPTPLSCQGTSHLVLGFNHSHPLSCPMSQPSSLQSTPSAELHSTMSEAPPQRMHIHNQHRRRHHTGRHRNGHGQLVNSQLKSIHYKDTEILDLFKGTRTVVDDKISDYEDVWQNSSANTPNLNSSKRLFTFKPDVIPNTTANTPDFDFEYFPTNLTTSGRTQKCVSVTPTPTTSFNPEFKTKSSLNFNTRLSLKNVNINTEKGDKGIYSEPLDTLAECHDKTNNNSVRMLNTNRWSQPALSVLKNNFPNKNSTGGSIDNLNLVYNQLEEVTDASITVNCDPSPYWKLDSSWQFCSVSSETQKEVLGKAAGDQQNKNKLTLKLNDSKNNLLGFREVEVKTPLSPSPENWDHLLKIVAESSKQLESLHIEESSLQTEAKAIDVSACNELRKIVNNLSRSHAKGAVFGPMLRSFIACTLSGKLQDPFRVMKNIRQFISGLKNYLVGVSAETLQIRMEIKKQTEHLKPSEFLNVDFILEQILVDFVISPLYEHVMKLLKTNLRQNRKEVEKKRIEEIDDELGRLLCQFLSVISPLEKMDFWNRLISITQSQQNLKDDCPNSVLNLLTKISPFCSTIELEVNLEFVSSLLPPSILERNLVSVSILKDLVSDLKSKEDRDKSRRDIRSEIKIIIPDERNGTLSRKPIQVRKYTTAEEASLLIIKKLDISAKSSDYVLVKIQEGNEKPCLPHEYILDISSKSALAFKRIDAKIGWPTTISQ